ncbi:MAG: UDP-N-acetylmuramoyl-tripeptide--D-alanyl-D-alanine ligase [Motiliproteus sp.]|nr:UDP-N-acetylmuramoyl-tripeptide--D-alanyl-D-alanine ligase [Motiliproteus sp.]MCW9051698.1 UDP-N-acetylmuramoyl-tripeptide--D-alanyl-D-alanine ligase [Motiliproteus sp.]
MISSMRLSSLMAPLNGIEIRGDAQFDNVSTDTRTLKSGDLFVALSGPNFDGNRFVAQAAEAGAVAAIVTEFQDLDIPQLRVTDSRLALGALAKHVRNDYDGKLVAITGSSGKTSVKEMLASVLRTQGEVLATKGNLNNEIGVPLTLFGLQAKHEFAVIELGASGAGEIAYTTGLTKPDVAVLNNAGGAHLKGFGSLQGVVEAKGEIFDGLAADGVGVVNLDDDNCDYWLAKLVEQPRLTFSLVSAHADLFASHLECGPDGCYRFVLNSHQGQVDLQLRVMGRHMAANAMAAAAAATALGLPLTAIQQGLQQFAGVPGRLAVSTTTGGVRVIDDSYNANPDSVKAAIQVLADLPGTRVLVLGNMAELGADSEQLHQELGAVAMDAGIHMLLSSGESAGLAAGAFKLQGGRGHSFEDNAGLANWLQKHLENEMVILVKGSRSAGMETVVKALLAEENR